jgi:hypothetical protein
MLNLIMFNKDMIVNDKCPQAMWTTPYLLGGFSAPFIFRAASTPQMGGRFAGTLFILAGAWSLWLARKHHYGMKTRCYLIFVFVLELVFWSWRFFNSLPMRQAYLLGFTGTQWHAVLTSLYLMTAFVLLISEFKRVATAA